MILVFHFNRKMEFYLLQNYLPCALIVMLSWVSFWINYRATPGRVQLGITTVLTIVSLSNSIRATLPPTTYQKAIDYYLLVCFVFVFAALIEYAIVGITDIKWRRVFNRVEREKRNKKETPDGNTNVKLLFGSKSQREEAKSAKCEGSNKNQGLRHRKRVSWHSSLPEGPTTADEMINILSHKIQQPFVPRETQWKINVDVSDILVERREEEEENRRSSRTENSISRHNSNNGAQLKKDMDDVNSSVKRAERVSILNSTKPKPALKGSTSFRKFALAAADSVSRKESMSNRWHFNNTGVLNSLAEKHRQASEIHIIDRVARYAFPISFLVFNAIYFGLCFAIRSKQ